MIFAQTAHNWWYHVLYPYLQECQLDLSFCMHHSQSWCRSRLFSIKQWDMYYMYVTICNVYHHYSADALLVPWRIRLVLSNLQPVVAVELCCILHQLATRRAITSLTWSNLKIKRRFYINILNLLYNIHSTIDLCGILNPKEQLFKPGLFWNAMYILWRNQWYRIWCHFRMENLAKWELQWLIYQLACTHLDRLCLRCCIGHRRVKVST